MDLNEEMATDKFLTFDDVLLMPQFSSIESRSEVDISSSIGLGGRRIVLQTPLISAPMDTVTGSAMASAMTMRGGLGIIHRYMSIEDQVSLVEMALDAGGKYANVGAAIGATGDFYERYKALVNAGARLICIDVAHGDHIFVERALGTISEHVYRNNTHVMAGNVASSHGYRRLSDWGADSVRVGVGGGSVCTTRINTGHGAPNIGALMYIDAERQRSGGASIVLDGGIKKSGDIVKALAFGADAVMCGGMLSGTDLTPGKIHNDGMAGFLLENLPLDNLGSLGRKLIKIRDRRRYKSFRGMASKEAQADWRDKKPAASEGFATHVAYKGSTHELISEIQGHIKSGFSYSGARNLQEFYAQSEYITQTVAGQREAVPHIHH